MASQYPCPVRVSSYWSLGLEYFIELVPIHPSGLAGSAHSPGRPPLSWTVLSSRLYGPHPEPNSSTTRTILEIFLCELKE